MSELPPKKEREENLKWIKWSAIFSGIAVLGTIFSGWMAYNASISTANISGKMSKENEIETRIWERKFDIYSNIIEKITEIRVLVGENQDIKTRIQRIKYILKDFEILHGKILIYGDKTIIRNLSCLTYGVNTIESQINEIPVKIQESDSLLFILEPLLRNIEWNVSKELFGEKANVENFNGTYSNIDIEKENNAEPKEHLCPEVDFNTYLNNKK
ncbi:hypothetical protein HOO68_04305 [Candidatus Gracilibacteria bacterium]|nr:hypothetical protein [Candidatus Gracilibacteria bacterium]